MDLSNYFGSNIFYLDFRIHIYIHEHITAQALGLKRKQYAYRVLLPCYYFIGLTDNERSINPIPESPDGPQISYHCDFTVVWAKHSQLKTYRVYY